MLPDPSLRILIVDESPVRAAILEEGLREAGYSNVMRIAERTDLLARVYDDLSWFVAD